MKKCNGCPYELTNCECSLSEFHDIGCACEGEKAGLK